MAAPATAGTAAPQAQHPARARARAEGIARLLTGRADASTSDGVDWLAAFAADLAIPGLSHWGVTHADIPAIVEQAVRSSSMAANPIVVTPDELAAAVATAL